MMKYPHLHEISWRTATLGAQVTLTNGSAFKAEEWRTKGVPIVRIQNLKDRRAPFNFYDGSTNSKVILKNGDLLFSWSGSRGTSFGPHFWWGETAVLNQHIFLVEVRRGAAIDKDFLYFALLHLTAEIETHAYGLGALVHVRKGDLERTKIPVPPVDEQRKIVAVLSMVQRAIERQERLVALTAELKKTFMSKLFAEGTGGEAPKQTSIGQMPQSWEPTPLGTCCEIVSSSMSYAEFVRTAESTDNDALPCMAVKVSDMNLPGNEAAFVTANVTKHLPAGIVNQKLVPPNTVVFPKRGAAIATNKKRLTTMWTVLDPNLIAVCPREGVDPLFLFYWLQTYDLRTITDPGPTPQLNKKDLTPVRLPLPSTLDEQRSVARALDSVSAKLVLQRRTLVSLGELFRALLYQLMTEQIRVHDLDLSALEETAQSAEAV